MSGTRLQLVAATANPHKLAEMRDLLGPDTELLPRPADLAEVVEDAPSIVGNAILKADAVHAATGLPALADDTGLEVAALDGAPGVRSARYAGEDADDQRNVELLLRELERVAAERGVDDRRARFVTWVVLSDGHERVTVEGVCEGTIAHEPRGANGFGYDPVFVPDEGDGRTFAEMSSDEKHELSHRGRAVRAFAAAWAERRQS
jgi:XTP/dITP diphosphohydrolase